MKPTAGDVEALSVSGGRLNGPLGIGTDNALGGNSIVFGDNDTGLKQNGDGILDIFANNQHTVRVAPGEMIVLGAIRAGNAKKLSLTSTNNSALNAGFNLWRWYWLLRRQSRKSSAAGHSASGSQTMSICARPFAAMLRARQRNSAASTSTAVSFQHSSKHHPLP